MYLRRSRVRVEGANGWARMGRKAQTGGHARVEGHAGVEGRTQVGTHK
jgi:hypothetical protein